MNNRDRDINTLPAVVQITVQTHISMLNAALPGLLESYYVIGSVALGAFTQGRSDIDFVAVTTRRPTAEDLNKLKKIHGRLKNNRLFAALDGLYVTDGDLRSSTITSPACARFNEGGFHGFHCFDANSIDALELMQYGICIMGRAPAVLPFNFDWNLLTTSMVNNVNTYWLKWADGCRSPFSIRFAGLYLRPELAEWGVLGISRIYFTLRERDVASKAAAGSYALGTVPEKWHRAIREALRLRNAEIAPQYKSIAERRNDVLGYMEYMLQECNRIK